jgi:hypothetical protein
MGMFRERIGNLAFNPSNANIQAHIEDAVLRGEVTPQDAQARLTQSLSIPMGQRAAYFNDMSVKTEERYKAATTKRGQDMSASTARRGQDMSATTAANSLAFQQQQAQNPEQQLVQDPQGNYFAVNRRTGQAMPVTNNALLQPPPVDGDAGAVATPTQLRGKVTVGTPVSVMIGGKPTLVPPNESIGKTPVTAATEKAASIEQGRTNVDSILADMNKNYTNLQTMKAIPSTQQGPLENIAAFSGATLPIIGRALGTEAQTERDAITQKRFTLVQAIKKSTGMSAQEMNSNVELQNLLDAATSPSFSIESNIQAMENISRLYGSGGVFSPSTGGVDAPANNIVDFGSLK